jgi:hypothetical protein
VAWILPLLAPVEMSFGTCRGRFGLSLTAYKTSRRAKGACQKRNNAIDGVLLGFAFVSGRHCFFPELLVNTADRGEYKNETYLLAIRLHILNTQANNQFLHIHSPI